MATPTSRFDAIGLSGRKGATPNLKDSYIKTVEFPVVAVASGAAQSTTVKTPTESIQVISAYLNVTTAEATAVTKTVDVGVTGVGAAVLNDADVSATGPVGTPITAAVPVTTGNVFTYTLAGADFAELVATCVVTYQGIDA
jgi:hypothetical protein